MRRLAHHLFTLCSAVSLLLCVAACALWVRSYVGVDYLTRYRIAAKVASPVPPRDVSRGHEIAGTRGDVPADVVDETFEGTDARNT